MRHCTQSSQASHQFIKSLSTKGSCHAQRSSHRLGLLSGMLEVSTACGQCCTAKQKMPASLVHDMAANISSIAARVAIQASALCKCGSPAAEPASTWGMHVCAADLLSPEQVR